MNILLLQSLASLLIFIVALIAGLIPFYKKLTSSKKQTFPIGEALACGVFLGAGLIHMLGDASSQFSALGYDYPWAFVIAGIAFLFMLWLEHLGHELQHKNYDTNATLAILATVMLSLHSFLAGAALGLSDSFSLIIVLLLAVLAHKWAAGFALAVQINQSNFRTRTGLFLFLIFAIMTPLGIGFGSLVTASLTHHPLVEPIFASLAAGTFLYLGTLHGLKNSVMVEKCCNLYHYSFVILGFVLMAVVAIWT